MKCQPPISVVSSRLPVYESFLCEDSVLHGLPYYDERVHALRIYDAWPAHSFVILPFPHFLLVRARNVRRSP